MKRLSRPNVLLIYTDQQRLDSLGCYGNTLAKTPHLDKLAAGGARFTNFYVQNPVCIPSRMSFLTGRYCSSLGVGTNGVSFPKGEATPISTLLRPYGYTTAQIGKLHFEPHGARDARDPYPDHGFDVAVISDNLGGKDNPYLKWVEGVAPEMTELVKNASALTSSRLFGSRPQTDDEAYREWLKGSYWFHTPFEGDEDLTHSTQKFQKLSRDLELVLGETMPTNPPRARLFLLLANFSHPAKDLVATTLAGLCKTQGVHFDAYYATADGDITEGGGEHHQSHQGGALFSVHGSMVLGGRHHQAVARALATFETTVVKLGEVHVFGHLVSMGAASVIEAEDLADLYKRCADAIGGELPKRVVVVQTETLPAGLRYGVAQYVFPEALYREAMAAPLELPDEAVKRLVGLGANEVWTVATKDADLGAWRQQGLGIGAAETLEGSDTYASLTFRMAEKWGEKASGFDLCEPVLASHWLPFALQEGRVQVCGESLFEAANKLAPYVKAKGERVVYGRYAGGVIGGAKDDEDLFGLFKNNIAYQVIEPRRPVLRVLSNRPAPLPQPSLTCWDLEPSDEQLKTWAAKGKILTTLVFHSGELSHDDAIVNVMDLCALMKVRVGVPVHVQRYSFNPDCVEPMHTPVNEGGVLGLCEPILHSGGFGILAESLGSPKEVAAMMKEARDEIATLVGQRFAPKGVYCYMDALPQDWNARPERLWAAIAEAGFDYVVSSVSSGKNRLLYRSGDFVVLNIGGYNFYPYSPFVRVNSPDQMVAMERQIAVSGAPGWMFGVIDTPIYAYSSYLAMGESLPSVRDPLYKDVRLGKFFDYVRSGGEMHSLISATPHTIARYARLLGDIQREADATMEISHVG